MPPVCRGACQLVPRRASEERTKPRMPSPPSTMTPDTPRRSERTCAGCGVRSCPEEMVRLRFTQNERGEATLRAVELPAGLRQGERLVGRGVHVHPRPACLQGAAKRGLARSLRGAVRVAPDELRARLREALGASVRASLAAAVRQRLLAAEEDARVTPRLRVHATDTPEPAPGSSGSWVRVGTRQQLGALVNQPSVAALVCGHQGLSGKVQRACALASAAEVGGLEVG